MLNFVSVRTIKGSSSSFALLMKGKAIRAKIEKSGYRSLKFLVAQPPNPIFRQSVCGESQSGEEVCMTPSVKS